MSGAIALTVVAVPVWMTAARQDAKPPRCRAAGPLLRLPDLPEGSGIAASRRTPGRLWAVNDSGLPVIVALDARGSVTARVRVNGAEVEDWEAIAVGPCASASCLYIADIGDNNGVRKRITVYRLPEPLDTPASLAVQDVFHATYPDRPHDAETLLVTPDGRVFVVTKGETGPVAIFHLPTDRPSETTVQVERVGAPRTPGKPSERDRITDGAVSPDGAWVVVRTARALFFYPAAEFVAGTWRGGRQVDLREIGEPQGEGVAIGGDRSVYLAGEGGGKPQGTFVRLTCEF